MEQSHVYVFDYNTGSIYHAVVNDDIIYNGNISLMRHLGLNEDETSFMISDEELSIIEIEQE